MLEPWIISAYTALLASVPTHLQTRLHPREGGPQIQQTQVLPVVNGTKQYALICYYETSSPRFGQLPDIYPPFAAAWIAYPSKEIEWKDVKPDRIGLSHLSLTKDKIPYLGVMEKGDFSMKQWQEADKKYYLLISRVLEKQWLLTRHPITAEEHATAKELQGYIRILYDKPLLPYYQHEGRQFLAWVERAAQ